MKLTEARFTSHPSEFPRGEGLDTGIGRKHYITLDANGEPDYDLAKIYPDPEKQQQFREDMDSLRDMHAVALKHPKWATITSVPADVVYYHLGGHPSCV